MVLSVSDTFHLYSDTHMLLGTPFIVCIVYVVKEVTLFQGARSIKGHGT